MVLETPKEKPVRRKNPSGGSTPTETVSGITTLGCFLVQDLCGGQASKALLFHSHVADIKTAANENLTNLGETSFLLFAAGTLYCRQFWKQVTCNPITAVSCEFLSLHSASASTTDVDSCFPLLLWDDHHISSFSPRIYCGHTVHLNP